MQTEYRTPESADLPRTIAAIERGIAQRLHIGAQLYVSLAGQVVADVALGEARRGVPMRADTLMLWLSAGKPFTAVAVAQLRERGLLDWDDHVARHIPEFAAGGKEAVTIRHLLTHTAGFRAVLGHWEDQPWDRVIAVLCAAKLEPRWVPGQTAGYHPLTSWYILAELVRRLDDRPFERYVREEIFLKLGMNDSWIGVPEDQQRAYGDRWGLMHDTREGDPEADYALDTPRIAAQCRPPSGARGPIRELARFYETLLNRGNPPHLAPGHDPGLNVESRGVLAPQSVDDITSPQRVGMYDKTFRHIVDWGLGFLLQSNQYGVDTVPYGYGPHASPRTFGHSGSRSSIGYADPQLGLVVACLFNGAPDEARHDARMREVNTLIYEELGLVG
jgi:CubicO group peptidase (beta-lactamase class C family)